MIATDGKRTVAHAPQRTASERIRAARKRTKIMRAWNTACAAYPEAGFGFLIAAAAKRAGVSVHTVERVIAA